ncbi:DUF3149 domain-containing protein [Catenovulum sediminis]|uniref:DUF3149 domain-containing protein n=1 Tax=Catenovulum sediminis TaxID=1740262 RepID=A0ABV1RBZ5_9ALTE|nr:DUF3149 domain-containing protein [Catenovulum sediminis]
MNAIQMLLNDPVVWGSLLGIATVISLLAYYVWLFLTNIKNAVPPQE